MQCRAKGREGNEVSSHEEVATGSKNRRPLIGENLYDAPSARCWFVRDLLGWTASGTAGAPQAGNP